MHSDNEATGPGVLLHMRPIKDCLTSLCYAYWQRPTAVRSAIMCNDLQHLSKQMTYSSRKQPALYHASQLCIVGTKLSKLKKVLWGNVHLFAWWIGCSLGYVRMWSVNYSRLAPIPYILYIIVRIILYILIGKKACRNYDILNVPTYVRAAWSHYSQPMEICINWNHKTAINVHVPSL